MGAKACSARSTEHGRRVVFMPGSVGALFLGSTFVPLLIFAFHAFHQRKTQAISVAHLLQLIKIGWYSVFFPCLQPLFPLLWNAERNASPFCFDLLCPTRRIQVVKTSDWASLHDLLVARLRQCQMGPWPLSILHPLHQAPSIWNGFPSGFKIIQTTVGWRISQNTKHQRLTTAGIGTR